MSVASYIIFFNQGTVLGNPDSWARLLIARKVVDSWTPGFAQLGGVWLPLTHIGSLPFIGSDFMYETGLAASIISMVSFVFTSIYLYKLLVALTGDKNAGLLGAFIFMINPNMLYLQSTPMTEMPLYLTIVASSFYLVRYIQDPDQRIGSLFWSGLFIAAGTLIRYEAWLLLPVQGMLILFVLLVRRFRFRKIESHIIYWAYWAGFGVAVWFLWNLVIFGDPLHFQRGEYAQPSLWVTNEITMGSLNLSFMTYWLATLANVGPILYLGILALILYPLSSRLRLATLVPLTWVAIFPAFVLMLYLGQRPLRVPELTDTMYNVRFALVMVLPVAVAIAYISRRRWWLQSAFSALAVLSTAYLVLSGNIINVNEAIQNTTANVYLEQVEAANWLEENYDGRPILLESFGNEGLLFESNISMRRLIYEGTYQIWDRALDKPQAYVDWIVMRHSGVQDEDGNLLGDRLWRDVRTQEDFLENFKLVYNTGSVEIYMSVKPTV
ncbi:MAG: glycosyltransferase family 39 protein [Chloroflexi bacterium]|nr:glycosyltransferase family 39 protein [Chloroflexota bacterium]